MVEEVLLFKKGGEFFFFSYDNKLMLKTLSNDDYNNLKSNLLKYFTHVKDH